MNRGAFELNVRDTLLTLVVLFTLLVNLIFAIASLSRLVSLYTLLVYLIVVLALNLLVDSQLLTQEDVLEALNTPVYPQRLRLPMRLQFAPIVALWLLWWLASQLFFEADIVFDNGLFVQLVLLPLMLATFAARCLSGASSFVRNGFTGLLGVFTLIALFLPTRDWAPQYTGAPGTVVRVVLYFLLILLLDYLEPPQRYTDLPGQLSKGHRELQKLNTAFAGLEEAGGSDDNDRIKHIKSVVLAHACVRTESHRVLAFAALSGWLLVTPLAFALLGFPVVVLASLLMRRPPPTKQPLVAQPAATVPIFNVQPSNPEPVPAVSSSSSSRAPHRPVYQPARTSSVIRMMPRAASASTPTAPQQTSVPVPSDPGELKVQLF